MRLDSTNSATDSSKKRVKPCNFGVDVVPPVTIIYPIDFLPAA